MKYKNGLVKEYEYKQNLKKEQEKLHEKHDIEDENIVVVEKSKVPMLIGDSFRFFFNIIIYILAVIGVLCLIYPDTRNAFLEIFNSTMQEVHELTGGAGA